MFFQLVFCPLLKVIPLLVPPTSSGTPAMDPFMKPLCDYYYTIVNVYAYLFEEFTQPLRENMMLEKLFSVCPPLCSPY